MNWSVLSLLVLYSSQQYSPHQKWPLNALAWFNLGNLNLTFIMLPNAHLQVTDVLEHKWVVDIYLLADFIIHGIDIGLIHCHTLLCQRRRVIDRDIM